MNTSIKGVHYNVSERTTEFINTKLDNLEHFQEMVLDVEITIGKESNEYVVDANVHFRWGAHVHLHEKDFELFKAIENLVHKLTAKVAKEKDKIKDHH